MMKPTIKIINGDIIQPYSIISRGNLLISDGIIKQISAKKISSRADIVIDAEGKFVSPGFIDIHIHGGGGSDFMDGTVKDFLTVAETHARFGTTAMTPTTLSCDKQHILHSIEVFREANKKNIYGSAYLGLHLEGPYFSIDQRGAQDEKYIKNPHKNEYREIILKGSDVIKRWSAAPELEGSLEFGSFLRRFNILPSIAHTNGTYDDVIGAFENGYTLATHFYSSMSGVSRRNAFRTTGVIEAVYLVDEIDVEVIADGVHLPAPLLQLILKVKGFDKTALITDAMRAAGTNVNQSVLGDRQNGLKVIIEDGVAKLLDRSSFAGSIATTDRLLGTVLKLPGVSIIDAIRMMSLTPARIMKIESKKGSVSIGKDGDIVLFDSNTNIHSVIIEGNLIL